MSRTYTCHQSSKAGEWICHRGPFHWEAVLVSVFLVLAISFVLLCVILAVRGD